MDGSSGGGRVDPILLAEVRAKVKQHLKEHGSVDGLDIEPSAPSDGMPFAFVSDVPTLPKHLRRDHDNWRRCSYCETNRKFIDGRLVFCADGRLRTIGFDCWEDHIKDADWRAAGDEWRTFQRRQRFLAMRGEMAPAAARMEWELRKLRETHAGSVRFADEVADKLWDVMPDLARALSKSDGGMLIVERMVPDFAGMEGARGQRNVQSKDDLPPRYKPNAVMIHRVAGHEILAADDQSVSRLLIQASTSIAMANERMKRVAWENVGERSFKREADAFDKSCRSAISLVDKALRRMSAVRSLFAPANITGIARWANDSDCELCVVGGRYEAVPGGIRYEPDRGNAVIVALPADYAVPDIGGLEKLRDALSAKA